VLVVSNLNLDGFIGRVFMIWLSLFGSAQLLVGPQSKGGTIKFDLFKNTWVVGRDTQPRFKKKVQLSAIIDNLEEIAEARPLFPHEILLKNQSNVEIARLLHEEEIK
jgi:hypothetical protein